jgi:hypothetical protein
MIETPNKAAAVVSESRKVMFGLGIFYFAVAAIHLYAASLGEGSIRRWGTTENYVGGSVFGINGLLLVMSAFRGKYLVQTIAVVSIIHMLTIFSLGFADVFAYWFPPIVLFVWFLRLLSSANPPHKFDQ